MENNVPQNQCFVAIMLVRKIKRQPVVDSSKPTDTPFCPILLLCYGFPLMADYLTNLILQEVAMDSAVSSSPFLRSVVEAIRVRHYSTG